MLKKKKRKKKALLKRSPSQDLIMLWLNLGEQEEHLMLYSDSWPSNIWYDYDRWQLGIKDIMNILYLKIEDNQLDLAMCLNWI